MRYLGATFKDRRVDDTPIETEWVNLATCPTKSSALKHHCVRGCKT